MKKKIYIVEDDPKLASLLKEHIEKYDYDVFTASDFYNIKQEFEQTNPHLVLLDIHLPRYDGFYWCRQFRTISNCPIIFISARSGEMDQVMAIENGGDDYITKPFNYDVLMAKIRGMMRRTYGEYATEKQPRILDIYGFMIDLEAMEMELNNKRLALTKKEFLLLKELMQHVNQVLTREHLLELLWDDQHFVDDNTLSVNITRLRKKLQELGIENAIQTVRGAGYKMKVTWGDRL
ncbi:DNA-binding response OmpR family regulator [Melghiribacillus thermohalophilus]|uniref:DNA-binding response OmpR family regulator n=1 Tax=Melghiribacillus thermohalophilus TaxID=1324956 RepID=A0A4R3MT05_9BACI|nr:response regulator transcription factor [Melghiribacillus thermohalophilus]TCT17936.1 DNA-binding response OmpR family regulator [Melghiribacillus thermohalophilus]